MAIEPAAHAALVQSLRDDPDATLHVDVAAMRLEAFGASHPFPLPPFAQHCLLEGVDQLGYLLGAHDEIARYESVHPALGSTTS